MPFALPVIKTAGEIAFTPVGNIASADVQAALAELDTEKVPYSGASGAVNLGTHNFTTTGDIRIASDTGLFQAGAEVTDYTFGWNGSDAVHTITAGDFVFTGGNFGIGTATPNAPLEVKDDFQGVVGGWASGILHITNKGTDANDNAVITGHNNYSTNKQLWYLGSMSNTNDDICFINRQNAELHFYTNNTFRIGIDAAGNVGIGEIAPQDKLEVNGTGLFKDKLKFTQDDGNEYVDSLNDGYMDYGATTGHRFDNDVVLPKTSGNGIKVDTATPTFPWRDLTGAIVVKVTGAGRPSFVTYKGNIEEYQFAINDKAEFTYHIPHDYVPGSDIHLHVHWSHISAAVSGGTITFGYELTYAKGHNQAPFGANKTGTIVATASATQYQHIVSEIQVSATSPSGSQIDSDDLEPDGLILIELFLNANNMTGATPDPFVHEMDVHYQSMNIGTKQKVPDFYT